MYNPSYLIKSRHGIYYFRHPLPKPLQKQGKATRISISLKTRCPKQALHLANILEYYTSEIEQVRGLKYMDRKKVVSLYKQFYGELLERKIKEIDQEGGLSYDEIEDITELSEQLEMLVKDGSYDISDYCTGEITYESPIHNDIKPFMEKFNLSYLQDSDEYNKICSLYNHATLDHYKDVLTYNEQATSFSMLDSKTTQTINQNKPQYSLKETLESYLKEIAPTLEKRSYNDQKGCLAYLVELFGEEFPVSEFDGAKVRYTKECLQNTPKRKNLKPETRDKTLLEQMQIAEELQLDTLSVRSVNKYLGYFSTFSEWMKNNKYVAENFFKGMKVKEGKGQVRREAFTKDEISIMLNELGKKSDGLASSDFKYWGTLIAIYTGARLNEVASLTPEDIKQDDATGIWYFDINDDGDDKKIKTQAAKRIVPIHSKLIELGFLGYVDDIARSNKGSRLLHELTYEEHYGWGRKLGRWVNGTFLKKLNLKTSKKSLHSLRHSFITALSVAGIDLSIVQSMVGHEGNTVTTQTYTHYGLDHLSEFKKAIEKM